VYMKLIGHVLQDSAASCTEFVANADHSGYLRYSYLKEVRLQDVGEPLFGYHLSSCCMRLRIPRCVCLSRWQFSLKSSEIGQAIG